MSQARKNLGGIYGGKKKNKPEIGKELKIFLEEPNDLRKILFIFHKPYFRWLLNEVGNK